MLKKILFTLCGLALACATTQSALASTAHQQPQYYGQHLCQSARFKCINIHKGDTWKKLWPNARNRAMVMRLNRTNIPLRYRHWIVVPKNIKDTHYFDLSPFPTKIAASNKKLIDIDLSKLAFAAYDKQGNLIHWGPISGGRKVCSDTGDDCATVQGDYAIFRKQGAGCQSSKYPLDTNGGAPMPYCMHFFKGFAMHGSRLPGYHNSHGCVRLFHDDAKWLNESFATYGTRVSVHE